jgi:hypothetical protein
MTTQIQNAQKKQKNRKTTEVVEKKTAFKVFGQGSLTEGEGSVRLTSMYQLV